MDNSKKSIKHEQLNKAKERLYLMLAIEAMIIVFSLVGAKTLFNEWTYRRNVVAAKTKAVSQLKTNISAATTLTNQYKTFSSANPNLLGGSSTGTGAKDGDNARVVLDALPSKYDFPALVASVEKMLLDRGLKVDSIGGTDDELSNSSSATATNPQPVVMNLSFNATGSYDAIQNVIKDLGHSIRPFHVTSISFSSNSNNTITASIKLNTYFQPTKSITVTNKEVK